jgi:hypothetical protein
VGNSALVVATNATASASLGYILDTSTNQIGAQVPIPQSIYSAAFTPDGASIWFVSFNGTAPPNTLLGETFPGGSIIGQMQTDANSIAFQP